MNRSDEAKVARALLYILSSFLIHFVVYLIFHVSIENLHFADISLEKENLPLEILVIEKDDQSPIMAKPGRLHPTTNSVPSVDFDALAKGLSLSHLAKGKRARIESIESHKAVGEPGMRAVDTGREQSLGEMGASMSFLTHLHSHIDSFTSYTQEDIDRGISGVGSVEIEVDKKGKFKRIIPESLPESKDRFHGYILHIVQSAMKEYSTPKELRPGRELRVLLRFQLEVLANEAASLVEQFDPISANQLTFTRVLVRPNPYVSGSRDDQHRESGYEVNINVLGIIASLIKGNENTESITDRMKIDLNFAFKEHSFACTHRRIAEACKLAAEIQDFFGDQKQAELLRKKACEIEPTTYCEAVGS